MFYDSETGPASARSRHLGTSESYQSWPGANHGLQSESVRIVLNTTFHPCLTAHLQV